MADSMQAYTEALIASDAAAAAKGNALDPSPLRRAAATKLFCADAKKGSTLDSRDIIKGVVLFEESTKAADSYLALPDEGLREEYMKLKLDLND